MFANKKGGIMLIKLSKFLSSDSKCFIVDESLIIDDEYFLDKTNLKNIVKLKGEIIKAEGDLYFEGTLKYAFTDECARCLKEFLREFEMKFKAEIVQFEDNESDEVQFVIKDGNIEMDEAIKQLIYLSMPMKSLCSNDCKGMCPSCGANLNYEKCQCENNLTDPRFDKLKDLL